MPRTWDSGVPSRTSKMRLKSIEEYKKTVTLSALQKEILVGLLLGDGHIEMSPNGKSARLKVGQSVKNSEYVKFLYDIFSNVVRMTPRTRTVKGFGKNFDRIEFTTLSLLEFKYFRDLFYIQRKKIVPESIAELLTEKGLAVWFMDDGSYKSKECKGKLLCTHNFTNDEIKLLCKVLKDKFCLDAISRYQIDGTEIYIRASSYNKLKELIFQHLVPSFYYKLESS